MYSPQAPSIIVNCERTHSNLLQIVAEEDGLRLRFLSDAGLKLDLELVGEEFLPHADYPETADILHQAFTHNVWDADLLWSIATMHEDHLVTALGHWALHNDDAWKSDSPDFVNQAPTADVA